MDTDRQLLESYARCGSERAFRELVERHIALVYSAALRECRGDASLAEDITQVVFTELARRAMELARHPALAGWLYTCVRHMTANVRRAEDRRQRRERRAAIMNEILGSESSDDLWKQLGPVLDDVMHGLNEEDRTVVVLRFFEGHSLKEIGLALGLTENAARMRVERSLEKLRSLLSQRGVKSTASALIAVLAAGAVITVPSTLAATVATGALATAASGSSSAFALAKLFSGAKGTIAAAGLFVLATAGVVWHYVRTNPMGTKQTVQTQHAVLVPSVTSPGAGDSRTPNNPAGGAAASPTNAVAASQMAFQLLDAETGQPIPHAKLFLIYLFEDMREKAVKAVTDADGRAGVDMPQAPYVGLNLFVTADCHVPKVMTWGFQHAMPPAEYTMKLDRGVTIGGVVVDEAGQPVADATISVDNPGIDMSLAENIDFGPDATTLTDAAGHWSCNMIPESFEQVSMTVTHPKHAESHATVRPSAADATNIVITMKAGFAVAGIVQDPNGNPVAGAKVREVRMNSWGEHSERTDDTGAFEFQSMRPGELTLAVQANGFAPAVQTLTVTDAVSGLRFPLGPGQLLRGHVTDEDGKPITNAYVEITRRGFDKVQWSTNTDSQGRFEWDSAPTEPLPFSFLAGGFNRAYAVMLQADGSDHEIKLMCHQPEKDTIQITGTVVDAETGQPLDAFNVMVGELDPEHAYPLMFSTAGKDGQFSLSVPVKSSHPECQIEIEKGGYQPAVSATLAKTGGYQSLEFKLQKGTGPCGVVLLPGGGPAVNAAVLLCTTRSGVTIDGPAHIKKWLNTTTYRTQTDAAGRFTLPAAIAPQGVIIVHDQGYGEFSLADLARTDSVTLQPWGRVEGKVILDSQPAVNALVYAGNQTARYDDASRRFSFLTYDLEARTDSAGRFTFDKVPPGPCWIGRLVEGSRQGVRITSHGTSVAVNAGAVTQVTLGGGGRPVTGKVVLPDATISIDWETVWVALHSKNANELGPRPQRVNFSSTQAYTAATERYFQAYRAQQWFGAPCDSSGSFRLADIPSGTYELEIHVRQSSANSVSTTRPRIPDPDIASIVQEVAVAEVPDGQIAEPLDLGTLPLVPVPHTDWSP
jgi:RNA polymerase sigma factor (sigma-70 family)